MVVVFTVVSFAQQPPSTPTAASAYVPPLAVGDGSVVSASAQQASPPEPTEKLHIDVDFMAGYGHDGMQASLGFEKQGRVGRATIGLSGRLHERFRYRLSFNPIDEVSSKPACGERDFFFPNDPRVYSSGPIVPCDVEDGHKRVDTYNTFALDYIVQQGPLREGYLDWQATDSFFTRLGRFILPIGFAPAEVGALSAKDMTRIQRLNAEANFGILLGYSQRSASGAPLFDLSVMGVLGDGNREKDYDWFYFANPTLDSNSALTAAAMLKVTPHPSVDLRAAYKKGFTGSKVERLPSYWASKRRDDALVISARVAPHPYVSVFGEYARYVWGPTETSAGMLGVDGEPIEKPGYYIGGTVALPAHERVTVGTTVTREELSRDDSLIKFLAAEPSYRVDMGKKDRATTVRFFVTVAQSVTAQIYWADVSNPFPWASGSWPVSGERAFTGRAPNRYGLLVSVKTSLFP